MTLEQAREYHLKYKRIGVRQYNHDAVIIWTFSCFERILALYDCEPEFLYFYEG